MPQFSYVEGAVERAKREKLHLVILHIDGKHARKGTITFDGPIGPKMLEKVNALFVELCNQEKRME